MERETWFGGLWFILLLSWLVPYDSAFPSIAFTILLLTVLQSCCTQYTTAVLEKALSSKGHNLMISSSRKVSDLKKMHRHRKCQMPGIYKNLVLSKGWIRKHIQERVVCGNENYSRKINTPSKSLGLETLCWIVPSPKISFLFSKHPTVDLSFPFHHYEGKITFLFINFINIP